MSASEQAQAQAPAAAAEEQGLLSKMINEFSEAARKEDPKTKKSHAEEVVEALIDEALQGQLTYDKNVTRTINGHIAAIDQAISKQLAAIMHHEKFQKLEGSWRGLKHLVFNSETNATLKLKVLNIPKKELFKDLDRAVEFDQSETFKKVYSSEFDMPGGEPYGAMIGDYEFTNHPEDIELLSKMSKVAAAGFCPFVAAASSDLFGFKNGWTDLPHVRDLEKTFLATEYIKWRAFRDSEDSRFVTLVMPRVLSRLPYGAATKPVEEFSYEELPLDEQGKHGTTPHNHYTWMNAAYVMGAQLTQAFSLYGFCVAIRGADSGGRIEGLPAHIFMNDDGSSELKCPTEIGITDRRENELSNLGFLPLCHYKNTDYAVFFGAQTAQKPKKYDRPDATANAKLSARLPYIMATSRFAHYLKVMARDRIGSFMEREDMENWLNRWIMNYVNSAPDSGHELRAKYPLREAKVEVQEVPGNPGAYNAKIFMRPWLQLEQLTASLSMVTKIPAMGGG
jgi:type VI secretion system protein ImpC